jgi:hypothetical protein
MQVIISPTWGVPTFIGGAGFGVGRFDLTRSPEEIIDDLLSQWDFLGVIDPASELELVRDRGGTTTRALTFRQRIADIPVHESRMTFTFDSEGRFIFFGGHFIPIAELLAPPHAKDCDLIVGTLDDQGVVITGCSARYSQMPRFTGGLEGELIPVFLLTIETGDGQSGSEILSEATGRFHRQVSNYTYAKRQVYHQETGETNYSLYYENEACNSPYCNDPDIIRIKTDLGMYASHMHSAHGRHSWEGHTDCTYPIQCPSYSTYVDDDLCTGDPACEVKWIPSLGRVQLDWESRKSTLVHEWSHAVIEEEAPGVDDTIDEGLADTYGVLFQGDTAHWCYHNYENATDPPYWREQECPYDHVEHGRCSMLAGDTVHDVPKISWVAPTTNPKEALENNLSIQGLRGPGKLNRIDNATRV